MSFLCAFINADKKSVFYKPKESHWSKSSDFFLSTLYVFHFTLYLVVNNKTAVELINGADAHVGYKRYLEFSGRDITSGRTSDVGHRISGDEEEILWSLLLHSLSLHRLHAFLRPPRRHNIFIHRFTWLLHLHGRPFP